jgi:hypothetical protein
MVAMLKRGFVFIVITLITHNVFCQSERLKFLSGDSVNLEKLAAETKPVLLDFYAS